MAQKKFDGIVEAVRYDDDGRIIWVRAFLRRGPTWSDHVLLERQALIDQLKAGKRFVVGHRLPQLAGTFETTSALKLVEKNGDPVLITEDVQSDQDCLKDVPLV
ncbi:MAG TPA: hypothetical protein VGA03_00470 [Anaerolineales bacterium]